MNSNPEVFPEGLRPHPEIPQARYEAVFGKDGSLDQDPEHTRQYEVNDTDDDLHDLDVLYSDNPEMGCGDYSYPFKKMGIEFTDSELEDFAARSHPERREIVTQHMFGRKDHSVGHRVIRRLKGDDFDTQKRLRSRSVEAAQRRVIRNRRFLERVEEGAGSFGNLVPDEKADLIARIEREIQADERIIRLSQGRSERQHEVADLVVQYETLEQQNLTEEEFTEAETALMGQMEAIYHGVLAEAQEQSTGSDDVVDDAVVEGVTSDESETVQDALQVEADQIKGKTESGNVIVAIAENIYCAYNISDVQIEWIKIDIEGSEFIVRAHGNSITPQNFKRQLGMARLAAVCNYYDLPFEQPEQDKLIEIYRGNAEIGGGSFDYKDYSDQLEDGLVAFLKALTPEGGQTKETFEQLGLIRDGKLVRTEALGQIVANWQSLGRDIESPEQFIKNMRQIVV